MLLSLDILKLQEESLHKYIMGLVILIDRVECQSWKYNMQHGKMLNTCAYV